jgi:hypothetical protein
MRHGAAEFSRNVLAELLEARCLFSQFFACDVCGRAEAHKSCYILRRRTQAAFLAASEDDRR